MKKSHLHLPAKQCVRKVITLSLDQTVEEAIDFLRKSSLLDNHILYFYVVDSREKLLGFISSRDLLLSPPDTPISKITNLKVKSLQGYQTMYEGLMLMQKFHLVALPVVEKGKFLGVLDMQLYFEEQVELNTTKKRMEVFQTLGFTLEESPRETTWKKYRTRVPWIFANMLGGILCAIISDFYEVVLIKVIVLAMFIPLVLSLSESISMQAMTQSMHLIGKKGHFWKQSLQYILHEAKLFSLIAITCGISVGFLSLLWEDGWGPALIIGMAIMISILVTATIGAIIPLILHTWKLDPKVASGPIVLMFADVITTLIYLSLAFSCLL